jgi:hypothetical protein
VNVHVRIDLRDVREVLNRVVGRPRLGGSRGKRGDQAEQAPGKGTLNADVHTSRTWTP